MTHQMVDMVEQLTVDADVGFREQFLDELGRDTAG